MPSSLMFLNNNIPSVTGEESPKAGISRILNYLTQQEEYLRYAFQNIDLENLSTDLSDTLSGLKTISDSLTLRADNSENAITELTIAANGLESTVSSMEDDIATVQTTIQQQATQISLRMTSAQVQSLITTGINGITLETSTATSNNQTTATLTLKNGTTTLATRTLDYTTKSQVTNLISLNSQGITLSVNNGIDSATITLSGGGITQQAKTIQFNGVVKFTDLSTAGYTTINGANITTGYLSADRIQSGTLEGVVIRSRNPNYGNFIEMTGDNISSYDSSYNFHGVRILSASSPALQYWYNGGLFFQIYYDPYDGKVYLYANAPLKIQGQYGVSLQSITDYIWMDSSMRLNNGCAIYDVNNTRLLG